MQPPAREECNVPAQNQPVKVVLADDHPALIEGVKQWLKRQTDIQLVGTTSTGDNVLQLAHARQPDVLVLDVCMPGLSSIEVVRQTQVLRNAPRVLMFSAHKEPDLVRTFLDAGALGYAIKQEVWTQFTTAIRTVAVGQYWVSHTLATQLVQHQIHTPTQPMSTLTQREIQVLRLLAKCYDNAAIATALCIAEGTVKLHVAHIYEKLGIHHRHQAVAWAWKHGMLEREQHH